MQTAFLALVNYILTALLLAYNVQAFFAVRKKTETRSRTVRVVMRLEAALIFTLCFLVLYLRSGSKNYLYFFLIQLAAYSVITFVYKKLYPRMSELLFDNMLLLLCIGSVLLARLDFNGAVRQFVIVAAALLAALFIPGFIRAMHRIERYGYLYLGIGIVVLLLVFFFAGERLGARIWVKLFGVAMQPGAVPVRHRNRRIFRNRAVGGSAGADTGRDDGLYLFRCLRRAGSPFCAGASGNLYQLYSVAAPYDRKVY